MKEKGKRGRLLFESRRHVPFFSIIATICFVLGIIAMLYMLGNTHFSLYFIIFDIIMIPLSIFLIYKSIEIDRSDEVSLYEKGIRIILQGRKVKGEEIYIYFRDMEKVKFDRYKIDLFLKKKGIPKNVQESNIDPDTSINFGLSDLKTKKEVKELLVDICDRNRINY
jgi:hypothetical protein